jgi:hypothetical protein
MLIFMCTPDTEKRYSSESDGYKEEAVVCCASVIWSYEQIKSDKTASQSGPPRAGSDPGEKFFSGAQSYCHGSRNELLGYEMLREK